MKFKSEQEGGILGQLVGQKKTVAKHVASIRLQHAIAKELVFRFYKARVL
jgi:hypothetical protein